jgi:hypothetical protein
VLSVYEMATVKTLLRWGEGGEMTQIMYVHVNKRITRIIKILLKSSF